MLKLETEMPKFLKNVKIAMDDGRVFRDTIQGGFWMYSSAFMVTNENVRDLFNTLDLQDKKVLSVIGAGDYIFNSVLNGATEIDGFDISMFAIMYYYLKEAALHVLSYEEFMAFFFDKQDKRHYNETLYTKIAPYLNARALPFWDLVMSSPYRLSFIRRTRNSPLILIDNDYKRLFRVSPIYDEKNYQILQEKMQHASIRVFLDDVINIDYLKGPYDYILLSNIVNYIDQKVFSKVLKKCQGKLTENGEIKVYLLQMLKKYMQGYDEIIGFRNAAGMMLDDKNGGPIELRHADNCAMTKRRSSYDS